MSSVRDPFAPIAKTAGSHWRIQAARRRPAWTIGKALACAIVFLLHGPGIGQAADFAPSAAPAPSNATASDGFQRWFVRFGALGVVSQTWSSLYSQQIAEVVVPGVGLVPIGGYGPQLRLVGRGASYSNFLTAALQAGYFLTPNWSVEIASAFPVWAQVKITGYSPAGPPPGTVLTTFMPAGPTMTAAYHFRQFGAFQPYMGAGIEPIFDLAIRNGFSTGAAFDPALGFVLQVGFEYMFLPNWGIFFDAKKIFTQLHGKANGTNIGPPIGVIPVAASIRTDAQPWVLATGLTYRF